MNLILKKITILCILSIILFGCQQQKKNTSEPSNKATIQKPVASVTLLSINDVYRMQDPSGADIGGLARVKQVRDQLQAQGQEVIMLHGGDFLHPSFSSRLNNGLAMIDVLNRLDKMDPSFDERMIAVFGNHEFDKKRLSQFPLLQSAIDASEFYWLDTNIEWKQNTISSNKLRQSIILETKDMNIGFFGITTDILKPEYVSNFIDIEKTARKYVPELKKAGADVVVALTHHWLPADIELLKLPKAIRPDLVIGGHEHSRQIKLINDRWIIKADADAKSMTKVEIHKYSNNTFEIEPSIVSLDQRIAKDPQLDQLIKQWEQKNEETFCRQKNLSPDCLVKTLGFTQVELVAEEDRIRKYETNIGNFLVDAARDTFEECGADIALVHSGGLRLNHNISAGSAITQKHIEGLFPYSSELYLIQIDGAILKQMLQHSVSNWTGSGHWLNVSGLAFIHDPSNETVEHVHLKNDDQQLTEDRPIKAVVPGYLINPNNNQDGYLMINDGMKVNCQKNGVQLKDLFLNQLRQYPEGISPTIDHRICNKTEETCQ